MLSPWPQRVPNRENVDTGTTPYRRGNPPYCQLLTVNLHVTLCVCVCVWAIQRMCYMAQWGRRICVRKFGVSHGGARDTVHVRV